MAIYIISFIISCICMKISEKYKKNRGVYLIFLFFALCIPCLIAGLRLYLVGTDTNVYVKPLFRFATNTENYLRFLTLSWQGVNEMKYVDNFEKGFSLLVYVMAKITGNFQLLLFIIHILIILPLYFGLKKFKSLENSKWFAMLVFYLMFFNTSLNAIRQYIGIAWVFWGTSCLLNEEDGKIKFFLSILVACLFHNASILGLVIYLIYLIIGYNKKEKKVVVKMSQYVFSINTFVILFLIIFSILLISNSTLIAKILDFLNLSYYGNYINGNVHFALSSIIEMLPIILLLILCGKKFIKKYDNAYFLIINYLLNYIIAQLSSVNIYAQRIGFIFSIFNIVFFAELVDSFEKKTYKTLFKILLIIYMLIFWYYNFVIEGRGETIPYITYNYMK